MGYDVCLCRPDTTLNRHQAGVAVQFAGAAAQSAGVFQFPTLI